MDSVDQLLDLYVNKFKKYIETYINSPRKELLLKMYNKYGEGLLLQPASSRVYFHNCYIGGYINHVINVVECALSFDKLWQNVVSGYTTYTTENLVFVAINHDLGKLGFPNMPHYIPESDSWRRGKGIHYKTNPQIAHMKASDRSLFILQQNNIIMDEQEFLAIKLHDGLYEYSNNEYLKNFQPEKAEKYTLPYVIHMADLMATKKEYYNWRMSVDGQKFIFDNMDKEQLSDNNVDVQFNNIFNQK